MSKNSSSKQRDRHSNRVSKEVSEAAAAFLLTFIYFCNMQLKRSKSRENLFSKIDYRQYRAAFLMQGAYLVAALTQGF